ncbi:MAG TPA: hypothetical protein VF275_13220 [Gammaproteobacteria bacterium]
MSAENFGTRPLRPSHAASALNGICLALADLIQMHGSGEVSHRTHLKMHSLAMMAELLSRDVSRWFGSQAGEDHDLLEALQDRYEEGN